MFSTCFLQHVHERFPSRGETASFRAASHAASENSLVTIVFPPADDVCDERMQVTAFTIQRH
jgi:hypothetical protein